MLADSLFLSEVVNKRTITLPDGTEHDLYFKEASSAVFRAYWRANGAEDLDEQEIAAARLIAASLINPDGTPAITVERAAKLKPTVSGQIIGKILEVNGFVKPAPTKAEASAGEPAQEEEAAPGNA